MAGSGRNEGVRVLGECVCEAIPAPGLDFPERMGRGVSSGIVMVADLGVLSAERVAELRQLSSEELLRMVRSSGSGLSREDLLMIHEIATERLVSGNDPLRGGSAIDLAREAMLVALKRSA